MPDRINILIVDDVPDKLLALSTLLEGPGVNIVTAPSGREALRKLLNQEFAVILLDVNMPDIDGFETAALIRQRKQTASTPIIFVTGYGDELHAAQGYSLGAVDFILTPVVPEVLKTKVGVFVELFRMREQIRQQGEERVALAREQALRAAAEEAKRRSQFLAEATAALTATLDFDETVTGLLRVVIPELADLAAVTLAGDTGQPWRSVLGWLNPADRSVQTTKVDDESSPRDELRAAHDRVLTTGRPELFDRLEVDNPFLPLESPARRLRRAIVLPLLARGRALGALTLAQASSGRAFSAADRTLAADLAERAAIALDNSRLYRDIREADRRKDEFLAMLAHELRNPLAPIRSSVEVLRRQAPDTPELRWAHDIIARQVRHMTRLIDDLLDVSRITRGTIKLQKVQVDIAAAVGRAVETVRPLIDERGHALRVRIPDQALPVVADPTRLDQIVANLLNNAAKYTPAGGNIDVFLQEVNGNAELRVRDSGIGIPANMLDRIFEPFAQLDGSIDRTEGGLGIGLTLVKRLLEMQGGSVRACSAGPGKGSEFIAQLPLTERNASGDECEAPAAVAPTRGSRALPELGGTFSGRRVLLVDDNVDGASSLALLLRTAGHEVRICHDGQSGLEAARTCHPDVVLLDIGLPGMNGFDVARALRSQSECDDLLLIAITGYGQASDVRKAREAGFDHHFVKPVDPDTLTELLASAAPRDVCAVEAP